MPEYFTLAELRALPDMDDVARYTDARVESSAAFVVAVIERVTGTSFISRTVTNEVHDGGVYGIVLRKPHVLSVTSATIDGVAVTETLSVRSGVVQRYATGATTPTAWTAGQRNVKVTYSAGYSSTVPADLKEAALTATRHHLITTDGKSGTSDRATSITNEYGNIQLSVAGENRPFGLPEVDAVVMGYVTTVDNFGFA